MSKLSDRFAQLLKRDGGETDKLNSMKAIRLVVAAVILALALVIEMPTVLQYVLFALSLIAAGYDLALGAVNSVEERDFFAASLILSAAAVVSYALGFPGEAAALVLVYQVGQIVIAFVDERSRRAALALLDEADPDAAARIRERLENGDTCDIKLAATMKQSAALVLKCAMAFAVLYVIVLLFLGDYTLRVSIHRALMILVLCTPASVVAAMPLTALFGLCFSAQNGAEFNTAAAMEELAQANAFVFDKAGVFAREEPRVLAVQSDLIDNRTLMNFAAHAVYYSEQPFAQAISAACGTDYMLEVISDFHEIPGSGVEVKISDKPVLLATASVMAERGVRIPQDQPAMGQTLYLAVAGRYVGKIVLSESFNAEAQELANEIMESGVRRCVLLTEDAGEEGQRFGEALGFDEIHSECDTEKKLGFLSELKAEGKRSAYIYANGFEAHSDAAIDIRIGRKSRFADALIQPEQLSRLPFALKICRRMLTVATENAVFAFTVKAVLVFLSMIGYGTLWFVAFVDLAASVATQLHAGRVTQESLLSRLKNR